MKKAVIVGDSYTFFMSGDPRAKQYLDHLNSTDEELFPIYWESSFDNKEDNAVYSWRLTTGARKIDEGILDNMILNNNMVKNAIDSGAILVFAFGAMEFAKHLRHTRTVKGAIEKYFNEVSSYCFKNNIKFRFVSPMNNSEISYMIEEFNDELDRICIQNDIDKVIRYNDSDIPYNSYPPADKHYHPSIAIMRDASGHILKNIA